MENDYADDLKEHGGRAGKIALLGGRGGRVWARESGLRPLVWRDAHG